MNSSYIYNVLLVVLLAVSGAIIACDDDGVRTPSDGATADSVTLKGNIAETAPDNGEETGITQQQIEAQVIGGIDVEVYHGDEPIAQTNTNIAGEFEFENIPCGSEITLFFTHNGSSVTLDMNLPCPSVESDGVISIVVSLDFQQGTGETEEVVVEEDILEAELSCTADEVQIIDTNGEEFVINGGANACIITDGSCELSINAPRVVLENCSTCIDARGGSFVGINAAEFECVSNHDGIRIGGNAIVDIAVAAGSDIDFNGQEIEGSTDGNIIVIAGENGASLRGIGELHMNASGDTIDLTSDSGGNVTIEGVFPDHGIKAVGASKAEVHADSCSVIPGTLTKGNSEILLNCFSDDNGAEEENGLENDNGAEEENGNEEENEEF